MPDFWRGLSRARLDVECAGGMKKSIVNDRVTKMSEESEPMVCDCGKGKYCVIRNWKYI